MTTSLAYQQATAPGGIGLEQMNQNIINFLAGNPDRATSEAAMAQYGVSDEDIRRATGKSFSDYYPTIGALPGALSATESPLSLVTSSADERQQGAIDAATTKPAEEFGTYRGIKMPTFSPIYGFQEDSGTIVQTPEQQTQAWMTEQDRLASLTPAQKAIEAAKYTYESGDNVFDTAYSPITFGGKTWQPGSDGRTLGRLADDQSGLGPKQYRYEVMDAATGQISQGVGVEGPSLFQKFLTNPVTGMVLSMALPGVGSAIGGALGITSPALAQAVGSAAVKFGLQVAGGKDPIEALKNVAVAEAMQGVSSAVGSMVPAELASVGKQVVTQLITTGQIDPVALATTAGADYAAGQLATQTGMNKSDALKLINAGVQVASGNIVGAGTSLISSAIQNTSKQAQQAFVDAKNSGATDAEAFEAASVIDPRISGQGVSGSILEPYKYTETPGGLIETGSDTVGTITVPNPQSKEMAKFGVNARADKNEYSLGAMFGPLGSPYEAKYLSSIMFGDVVDAGGKPVGYLAVYDPDTGKTQYEISLTTGQKVVSDTRPFIENNQIVVGDQKFSLSKQELEQPDTSGSGEFIGKFEDLAPAPAPATEPYVYDPKNKNGDLPF